MTAAGSTADRLDRSRGTDHAVRVGLVAYGVVHLLVALVAGQLAFGDRSESADATGALKTLAGQPFGAALVWAVAVGLMLLVLWRVLEIVVAGRGPDAKSGGSLWRARASHALKAVVYGVLAISALRILLSDAASGEGGRSAEESTTARLISMPGGPWLVVAVGLAVLGYGGVLVWSGLSRRHAKDLAVDGRTGSDGKVYVTLGAVGHAAKGVGIGIVGGLFVHAGLTADPEKSGGLDEALNEVLQQPYGPFLLLGVAVGIGCYGIFCFASARHLSR
ncbi:MAG: DUF1206 domain-containing protein [Nocardioides sp.]|nr:DUF1206 domain-containing protein [Nocardioides sp.]